MSGFCKELDAGNVKREPINGVREQGRGDTIDFESGTAPTVDRVDPDEPDGMAPTADRNDSDEANGNRADPPEPDGTAPTVDRVDMDPDEPDGMPATRMDPDLPNAVMTCGSSCCDHSCAINFSCITWRSLSRISFLVDVWSVGCAPPRTGNRSAEGMGSIEDSLRFGWNNTGAPCDVDCRISRIAAAVCNNKSGRRVGTGSRTEALISL